MDLIERARRYIAKCPPAISGQGGHDRTFRVASILVWGFALPEDKAFLLLQEWNRCCEPAWSSADLLHKVRSAATALNTLPRGYLIGSEPQSSQSRAHATAPILDRKIPPSSHPAEVAGEFLSGFRCNDLDLAKISPVKIPDNPRLHPILFTEALYNPGELLNLITQFQGEIKARPLGMGLTLERNKMLARFQAHGPDSGKGGAWLRMNPVDGKGIADRNVVAFRFALLESDKLPWDLQLCFFAKLPLPIAALLDSGGLSIHAWVKVNATDINEYRFAVTRMLQLLARFGVDGKNKNPSRLSRLPGARRQIGATGDGFQRLLYLNPDPKGQSIA